MNRSRKNSSGSFFCAKKKEMRVIFFNCKEAPDIKEVLMGRKKENRGGTDYRKYAMTAKDTLIGYGIGLASGFLVLYIFYHNIFISAAAGLLTGIFTLKSWKSFCIRRRQKTLLLQFKDFLESFSSSISAGRNVPDALRDSYKDLKEGNGEEAFMTCEVGRILSAMENNIPVRHSLYDLAERSGLEDIRTFADVFSVIADKGGDIRQVVNDTRNVINDKIETEQRIASLLSSGKHELAILLVLPLIVTLVMDSGGITSSATKGQNITIKTVCLIIFLIAALLGRRFVRIKA